MKKQFKAPKVSIQPLDGGQLLSNSANTENIGKGLQLHGSVETGFQAP